MEKKTIGAFLAALRKANGMTQQEVADRLNVSNKAVSRWERDECAPDISLIPAIAEMFGVTCDELLKGERILEVSAPEKAEPKVEKQIKSLINRSISSFQMLIWISLALSAVGLACMYGISYGFYRPVIGFFVMLMFVIAAVTLAVIGVGKMRETKADHELLESASREVLARYNRVLARYSYEAFAMAAGVVLLSLPLILFTSDYVESVLAFSSYWIIACIVLLLFSAFLILCKRFYHARITGEPMGEKMILSPQRKRMDLLQLGAVSFACVLLLIAPYFETGGHTVCVLPIALTVAALLLMLADVIVFAVYIVKYKKQRAQLLLPGIRNTVLALTPSLMARVHRVGFWWGGSSAQDSRWERYDDWDFVSLLYALILVGAVFLLCKLIEQFRQKKAR